MGPAVLGSLCFLLFKAFRFSGSSKRAGAEVAEEIAEFLAVTLTQSRADAIILN